VRIEHDVEAGARGADVVVTDTWISMADKDKTEEEKSRVREFYGSYRVDERVMGYAKEGAIFMHCLPMYRGEEVTPEVADGVNSVVWDEAENRLHGQKAVLRYCVGGV
jgi:ornithine carbamoyltransferase